MTLHVQNYNILVYFHKKEEQNMELRKLRFDSSMRFVTFKTFKQETLPRNKKDYTRFQSYNDQLITNEEDKQNCRNTLKRKCI